MCLNENGKLIAVLPFNAFLCSKCLMIFTDRQEVKIHAANCHPKFTEIMPLTPRLSVAHITPDSLPFERRICERMSKISFMVCNWDGPILRRNKWIRNRWYMHTYLLIDREEVASYIVMGRVNSLEQDEFGLWHKDIITDEFTVENKRKKGNMKLLVLSALKSMHLTIETVWFQEPLSEEGEKFLYKMSEETGLDYRTC